MTDKDLQANRLHFIKELEALKNKAYSGLTCEEYNGIRLVQNYILMRYKLTERGDD